VIVDGLRDEQERLIVGGGDLKLAAKREGEMDMFNFEKLDILKEAINFALLDAV